MEQSSAFSDKHQLLVVMAGDWNASIKFFSENGGVRSTLSGKMSNKMILGGRFLEQDFRGEVINGRSFNGCGFLGYNDTAKIWQSSWIDTASTQMQVETGSYNLEKMEWEMRGIVQLADDKQLEKIGRIKILNNNEHSMSMSLKNENQKETQMMEIHYTRVKK